MQGRTRRSLAACLFFLALISGCTNHQLRISTSRQARTLTEIQYEQVLDNLAMYCVDPFALPSLVSLKTGSTQVGDTGTLGLLGVAALDSKFELSPTATATRSIVDQWGNTPVTDDNALTVLRKAFRTARGFPELLSEDEANDMAHDLAQQVGTNSDISSDDINLQRMFEMVSQEKAEKLRRLYYRNYTNSLSRLNLLSLSFMDRKSERFSPIESPDLNYLASEETSIVGERSPLQQFLAYYVSDCSISTSDETILVARPEGDGSPYFEAGSDGYQLCLLFGVNRLDSLPTTGKRLIIVADVNGTLYFRLFDHRGHLSINTNENDMISINKDDPEETVKQKALKRENLESFKNLNFPPSPPSHEPMVYKQGDIVDEVMTIIGYSRSKEERISPPTALVKETVRRVNDVQKELVNITALGNGWYHFGCRKALPPNAAYVGRARVPGWSCGHRLCPKECYVWVCPEGRKALADFTRSIIKLSGVFKDTQVVTVPSGIQYSPAYSSSPVR